MESEIAQHATKTTHTHTKYSSSKNNLRDETDYNSSISNIFVHDICTSFNHQADFIGMCFHLSSVHWEWPHLIIRQHKRNRLVNNSVCIIAIYVCGYSKNALAYMYNTLNFLMLRLQNGKNVAKAI